VVVVAGAGEVGLRLGLRLRLRLGQERRAGAWESGVVTNDDGTTAAAGRLDGEVARGVVALSRWIDDGNAHRDPEAQTWARLAKVAEESGEVVAAWIGATGQNPRKGVTHTLDDVADELCDVALTALCALEHLRGHDGRAVDVLADRLARTLARARLTPTTD